MWQRISGCFAHEGNIDPGRPRDAKKHVQGHFSKCCHLHRHQCHHHPLHCVFLWPSAPSNHPSVHTSPLTLGCRCLSTQALLLTCSLRLSSLKVMVLVFQCDVIQHGLCSLLHQACMSYFPAATTKGNLRKNEFVLVYGFRGMSHHS